jgi:8-oxo-dGTP pyrophosphatase MutT (NUDIX family)
MKNYNFCNNCGKLGHLFHQCKLPITSIGIIAFRLHDNRLEYLLIRRKDSLGFVDFLRGKYTLQNKEYLINLLNKMTISEKEFLLKAEFSELWNHLWGENVGIQYRSEEKLSQEKFDTLKSGVFINNQFMFNLESLIKESNENYYKYIEPEWGFPKGRRNYQEKDLCCALREFEEETGYSKNDITIINNLFPIEEIFTSYNCKSYKHKYFLAFMESNIVPKNNFQLSEIDKIEWVNVENISSKFRYNNYEKIKIINILLNILNNYKIYI